MSEISKRVKSLLLAQKHGVLAVLDKTTPYGALVNYACGSDGCPIFLISTLARHTQALLANPAASLLISDVPATGDILTGQRASFMGRCVKLAETAAAREIYLAKHPYAAGYVDFGDFSFWKLEPELVHTVAGFGQIATLSFESLALGGFE